MKKHKSGKLKPKAPSEKNLALISVILGAASFTNTVFTGIPALILGVKALKAKSGNQTQAKLGIIFGTLGCLLLIPIVWLAVHFLHTPFNEQFAVSREDYRHINKITKALRDFKHDNKTFPVCYSIDTVKSCSDWQRFINRYPGLVTYPVEFEDGASQIQDRPAGTLVYATKTSCLLSIPTEPSLFDDSTKYHLDSYAALVYFHDKGRACFMVEKN